MLIERQTWREQSYNMRRSAKKELNKTESKFLWEEGSGNVFEDIGFSKEQAINLLVRADLMIEIRRIIRGNGWSQRKAAKELGVAQPRIAEIMGLKIDCFSVDALLKYLDKLGQKISFDIKPKEAA